MSLTHTFTSNITSGEVYKFKYYAVNTHGDGESSPELEVLAATTPASMNKPVVTLESGLKYRATFVQPSTGGDGVAIEAYEVVWLYADGTTFMTVTECDGSADAVKTNLYCEADLETLVDSETFNLVQGDEVVAKIKASNSLGFSPSYSDASTGGAKIVAKPATPPEAPLRNSNDSTLTAIKVDMQAITGEDRGGLDLLSYSLEWNGGGSGEISWTSLVG